jgi:hypothetical protein
VWIHRIARHLEIPEGDVGVQLIKVAIHDPKCIEFFQTYFKRAFPFTENHTVFPTMRPQNIYDYLDMSSAGRDRFKIKATGDLSAKLDEFQIALGISYLAHAVKALLEYALQEHRIIQKIAPNIDIADYRKTLPTGRVNPDPKVWSVFK